MAIRLKKKVALTTSAPAAADPCASEELLPIAQAAPPATGVPCDPKELPPVAQAASPATEVPWDPKKLLSIAQAAEFVGVAKITVRRWVKLELLPHRRAGKQIRIDKADLLKFLDQK